MFRFNTAPLYLKTYFYLTHLLDLSAEMTVVFILYVIVMCLNRCTISVTDPPQRFSSGSAVAFVFGL
jgi:hypothetical protein